MSSNTEEEIKELRDKITLLERGARRAKIEKWNQIILDLCGHNALPTPSSTGYGDEVRVWVWASNSRGVQVSVNPNRLQGEATIQVWHNVFGNQLSHEAYLTLDDSDEDYLKEELNRLAQTVSWVYK